MRKELCTVHLFYGVMLEDLIPMIDRTFRTYTDREHRAMAGLSWGAIRLSVQLCLIWINFLILVPFSGAIFGLDVKTCYNGVFADAGKFNKKCTIYFGMWDGRTVWNETTCRFFA